MTRTPPSRRMPSPALAALAIAVGALSLEPADAAQAPNGKSLIYAGWHGLVTPTPDFIRDNFEFLESQPFNGLVVYLSDPAFAVNATTGVMTDTAMTLDQIAAVLDPIRDLPFSRLRDNFGYVIGNSPPDFFDDWSTTVQNFRNLARALKEAGLKGFFFDNEQYFSPWASYPDGVAYPQVSLQEYQAQASLRGREVMEAMVSEFPAIVVVTLHGPYISEPYAVQQMGFPGVLPNYLLLGPFFVGFLQGAWPDARSVDGGELYWFRGAQDFADSYALRKVDMASDAVDSEFIPASLRPLWSARSSISFGILDRPFMGEDMTPEILTATLLNALGQADRWVWLYSEDRTFLKPESAGGAAQAWVEAVRDALPVEPVPASPQPKEKNSSCGLLGGEAVVILFALRRLRSRRPTPA